MTHTVLSSKSIPAECIRQPAHVICQIADMVEVKFTVRSACAHCDAKGSCMNLENVEKTATIKTTQLFEPGEEVVISMERKLGGQAVVLGFVFPLILLVSVLLLMYWLTGRQGLSALAGLLSLLPYFWLLYIMRRRIEQKFELQISKAI